MDWQVLTGIGRGYLVGGPGNGSDWDLTCINTSALAPSLSVTLLHCHFCSAGSTGYEYCYRRSNCLRPVLTPPCALHWPNPFQGIEEKSLLGVQCSCGGWEGAVRTAHKGYIHTCHLFSLWSSGALVLY
jgi:hypothetical protein